MNISVCGCVYFTCALNQNISNDVFLCILPRTKIDSIISKQTPHPDPDAPEDPESVRFWATCGGSLSQKERSTISAAAAAKIQSNSDGLAAMVGAVDLESGENGTKVGNGPTLKALVDVANTVEPSNTPGCKAKAKAKAKAKSIAQQTPKTPAEHRKALGNLDMLNLPNFLSYTLVPR